MRREVIMIGERNGMRKSVLRLAGLSLAAGLLVMTAGGQAALAGSGPQGDAKAARPLIASLCTKCHLVPGFPDTRVQPAVQAPSFAQIAENPQVYTDARIARFLQQPHWPMQGIILSKRDIANVLAFIHQLRQEWRERGKTGGK